MRIRSVFFDFDGTLADSFSFFMDGLRRYAPVLGFRMPDEKEASLLSHRKPREIIAALGISRFKLPLLVVLVKHEMRKAVSQMALFDGITALLHEMRSRTAFMGVVSSNSEPVIRQVLRRHGCELFDTYSCGISLEGKAVMLRRLVKKQELDCSSTIYVGDEIRDIVAARDAGIMSGAVAWGYNPLQILSEYQPDFCFSRPEQIMDIVQNSRIVSSVSSDSHL